MVYLFLLFIKLPLFASENCAEKLSNAALLHTFSGMVLNELETGLIEIPENQRKNLTEKDVQKFCLKNLDARTMHFDMEAFGARRNVEVIETELKKGNSKTAGIIYSLFTKKQESPLSLTDICKISFDKESPIFQKLLKENYLKGTFKDLCQKKIFSFYR